VNVEDKVGVGAIRVGNVAKRVCRPIGDKSLCRCPVVSGEKNYLVCGTLTPINKSIFIVNDVLCLPSLANGGDGSLDGLGPSNNIRDVVRLVHDTEDNLVVVGVFGRDVTPQRCEDVVGWSTLANDLSASI
jgi:hypothetical protein